MPISELSPEVQEMIPEILQMIVKLLTQNQLHCCKDENDALWAKKFIYDKAGLKVPLWMKSQIQEENEKEFDNEQNEEDDQDFNDDNSQCESEDGESKFDNEQDEETDQQDENNNQDYNDGNSQAEEQEEEDELTLNSSLATTGSNWEFLRKIRTQKETFEAPSDSENLEKKKKSSLVKARKAENSIDLEVVVYAHFSSK